MEETSFDQVLDECLARVLDGGEDLNAVLAQYPEQSGRLRPLLWAASGLYTAPFVVGRRRLLDAVAEKRRKLGLDACQVVLPEAA